MRKREGVHWVDRVKFWTYKFELPIGLIHTVK